MKILSKLRKSKVTKGDSTKFKIEKPTNIREDFAKIKIRELGFPKQKLYQNFWR